VETLTFVLWTFVWTAAGLATVFVLFMIWAVYTYGAHVDNVLQRKPLFIAENQPHREGGEPVDVTTASGRRLSGSYFHHSADRRRGVVVFCHEFAGDRWLFEDYLGPLLNDGFDVFSFDFCNHGKSDPVHAYEPLQWVTTHEVEDVRAVMDALRQRPDADPQGVALFGVSKGGGAALAAAADWPSVWAVVMDGAYPNHGMVVEYMTKWVGIFSKNRAIYTRLPRWFFQFMCEWGLFWMARRKGVKYVRLERALKNVGPRPVLMIRGGRDNYVTETIIDDWFAKGDSRNKERWEVAGAKHNRCVERANGEYHQKVVEFLDKYAPVPAGTLPATRAEERPLVIERPRPQPAPSV
jgi:pimeloyl-ACP methyl ester carboxylesterase